MRVSHWVGLFLFMGTVLISGSPFLLAQEIGVISLTDVSFNPSLGEKLGVTYVLPGAEKAWVRVYDPDGGLVRTLVDGEARKGGSHGVSWDGRDVDGLVVPNEAYTMTVETASGRVDDPVTHSGGEVGDITDGGFDRRGGTLTYRLPTPSRVLVRLGIRNGPMLKTLVDWEPRVAGTITEYWDGKDEDGLIDLWGNPDFTVLITYVTLPEATVITYGNREEGYRDYKLGRARDRDQKPDREPAPELTQRLRPEGLVPPAWARAPRVSMRFPQLDDNPMTIPEVNDEVRVRIDVDPADRSRLQEEQFEILLYVDNVFFAEAERGYLPFNWPWELQQLQPGEHLLTVNISSFRGQVGVASRKVNVVRKKD